MPKKKLNQIKACPEAVLWAERMGYSEETPMIQLWDDCDRLDWMMWFYFRLVPPRSKKDRIEVLEFIVSCYEEVVIEEERSVDLMSVIIRVIKSGKFPRRKGGEETDAIEAYGVATKSKTNEDFIYAGLLCVYAALFVEEPEHFANVAITSLGLMGVDLSVHTENARSLFRQKIVDRGSVQ